MHINALETLLDASLDLQLAEDVPPCVAKLNPEHLKRLARGRIPDQFFQTATFLSPETEAYHSAIIRVAFTTAHWRFEGVAVPIPSASKSHSFGRQIDFR